MNRGFYSAVSAMSADIERFNVMANNLANVSTHGYKKHQTLHHDFESKMIQRVRASNSAEQVLRPSARVQSTLPPPHSASIGTLGSGTLVQSTWTSYADGALEQTERNLDLALQGEGFFVIEQPNNQVAYTRDGAFSLNIDGELVTSSGFRVLSDTGPIRLAGAQKITINSEGEVFADGQRVEKLLLANFEEPAKLMNAGQNLYRALPEMPELYAEKIRVYQGYLERSNVNVADEMVKMVSALRAYQASSKALTTQDDLTGRLINEVGRPS